MTLVPTAPRDPMPVIEVPCPGGVRSVDDLLRAFIALFETGRSPRDGEIGVLRLSKANYLKVLVMDPILRGAGGPEIFGLRLVLDRTIADDVLVCGFAPVSTLGYALVSDL